jgi:hypothetical protein
MLEVGYRLKWMVVDVGSGVEVGVVVDVGSGVEVGVGGGRDRTNSRVRG